jgi:hypothetical protein
MNTSTKNLIVGVNFKTYFTKETAMQIVSDPPMADFYRHPVTSFLGVQPEWRHEDSSNVRPSPRIARSSKSTRGVVKHAPPDFHRPGSVAVEFRSTGDVQVSRRIAEGVMLLRQWGREAIAARSLNEPVSALAS